jgi:hypothetical protein
VGGTTGQGVADRTCGTGQRRSLQDLSEAALQYGAALRLDNPEPLAGRLYGFHRYPLSPRLAMALPNASELREFVLKQGPRELTEFWRSQRYEAREGWLQWTRRDERSASPTVSYKLYVSPPPASVRDVLRELVPLVTESGSFRFKVGANPLYLVRPDKLIVYFGDWVEAIEAGRHLADRLHGMPVHGVPLTCPVDQDGLVSWGVDPPASTGAEPRSWRAWLCSELARAMTGADPNDRVAAAHERLDTLGIDATSWTPPPDLWRGNGSD